MARKLIAKRTILYQGRLYPRGEAVPANDPVMTAAWLRADSAAWAETPEKWEESSTADSGNASCRTAEQETCGVLETLGVVITDEDGHFVGEENLTAQLRILGENLMQDYGDLISSEQETSSQEETPPDKVLDMDSNGHFTQTSLSRLTKAELLDLARDMKVDISGCKTNAERVEALASVDAEAARGSKAPPPEQAAPKEKT